MKLMPAAIAITLTLGLVTGHVVRLQLFGRVITLGLPRAATPVAVEIVDPPAVIESSAYRYDAPPSITREKYMSIFCDAGTAACGEAGEMYDVLVESGIDPVIQAAQAMHETTLGTLGVGNPNIKNMHGVQCFSGDGRIGDSSVPWGNGCAGIYASYTDSVRTWAEVINREYVAEGLDTPDSAVWKYAPPSDGNNPPAYIVDMHRWIDTWRQ